MSESSEFCDLTESTSFSTSEKVDSADKITIDQDMTISEFLDDSKESYKSVEEEAQSPTTAEQVHSFKCVFCEQILSSSDNPKLLECLHNACSSCVGAKLYGEFANESIECAQCHQISETSRIIENHFLIDTTNNSDEAAKNADAKCSSCSDDAIATSWCVDCCEFICDSCVQAHQRLKITKDHTIKSKEESLNDSHTSSNSSQNNLFCSVHPQEKLSLFCETCDKLTCRDCQLIEHREHKYKFTNEIALETRKCIADMLKDVGYKRVLLGSAMKVIEDRQTLITEKKKVIVKEITQLAVKLTNAINIRGKQLIKNLNEVCDSKQNTLNEKKQALEQLSEVTDYCIEFTNYALDNGDDMALLYSKKQMIEHLKRIKCKRADIPNPEIPVRIHLSLDKVPEIIKIMSTIGQIVVDGRLYPAQSLSPNPIGQNNRPPQQQSPVSPQQQSSNYQQFNNYQTQRLPPAYGQQYSNNNNGNQYQQQQQQKIGPPNMGPPSSLQLAKIQHLKNLQMQMQKQRPLIPRIPTTVMPVGLNQQQQVSSSTHPQGILGDRNNLRCLLQTNNNPVYVQTGPGQYQAVQPHIAQQYQKFPNQQPIQQQQQQQQQQMQFYTNPQQKMMQQQQLHQQQQQQQQLRNFQLFGGSARWHIPQQQQQQMNLNEKINKNPQLPTINDNFKITLKQQQQQQQNLPSTVTSTIPKTPSPTNHILMKSETEHNLDKFCQESVNDLMATIAKLDSNGVKVVAENHNNPNSINNLNKQKLNNGNSSLNIVDSSTGDTNVPLLNTIKNDPQIDTTGKDDPNEDWCAVCMDGGELVCCDKCPKVFHQYCHIPNLTVEENDTWQCLLCMNFADMPETMLNERKEGELNFRERKIAERIILELYCQYDPSLPFREIIGQENIAYHAIIKNPIALDTIRQKLNWNSNERYINMEQLIKDVRLMFKNAYIYNPEDSQVYLDAKTLEKFFDEQLEKFLPEYAYETFDDDLQPPNRKYRRIIND